MSGEFGQFIRAVEERDIDLLLLEELHVSHDFAKWFIGNVGEASNATFDGAWHSVSDRDGETDLLIRAVNSHQRVLILIENKIAAPEQEAQDQRYHLRGTSALEAGQCDRFITAICAPQVYLDGLPSNSGYEHRIPYEAIAEWFSSRDGERAAWRRSILDLAVTQARRGYVMKVHAGRTAFHQAYFEHLRTHHPEFVMKRPGPKGPKSDWMLFTGIGFPKGVKLVHKNDQSCVDLEFERTLATDLASRRQASWPDGVAVVQRSKSAALSLQVPSCDMDRPLDEQVAAIEQALIAARQLAACLNAEFFGQPNQPTPNFGAQ